MKIIFDPHSLKKIKERKISVAQIRLTVKNPEETELSYRGRQLNRRKFGKDSLEVVTVEEMVKLSLLLSITKNNEIYI